MAETKSKTAAKKPAAKKAGPTTAKTPVAKAKPAAKAKKSSTSDSATYTKPDLREHIKEKVKQGDKGGRPGQWSARKAQLVASEYEKEGGGYTKGGPTAGQEHLKSWTEEKWQTADGKKAIQGKSTSRYLPKKAWDKLSPVEKKATDTKKKTVSETGKQFVANTPAAKKARKQASK